MSLTLNAFCVGEGGECDEHIGFVDTRQTSSNIQCLLTCMRGQPALGDLEARNTSQYSYWKK